MRDNRRINRRCCVVVSTRTKICHATVAGQEPFGGAGRHRGSLASRRRLRITETMNARVEEARRCFDAHDTNGNGTIEADELQKVLTTLGLRHEGESEEAFRALVGRCMREHDANADGTLSFNEFQRLYNAILEVSTDDRRGARPSFLPLATRLAFLLAVEAPIGTSAFPELD